MKLSSCSLLALLGALADAGKTSLDVASLVSAKLGVLPGSEAHKELTAPNLDAVTGPLLDLLKQGQDSNNSEVVQSIDDILEGMKTRLWEAHNRSLGDIEAARQVFDDCLRDYKEADTVRFPDQAFLQAVAWYDEHFKSYEDCKQWEEELNLDLSRCDYFCLEESKTTGENCTVVDEDCAHLGCAPFANEGYEAYLDRMVSEISAQIAAIDGYTYNDTHRCKDIVETSQKCYEHCEDIIKPIVPDENNIPGCCAPRAELEERKCSDLKSQREAWTTYSRCYDNAIPNWDTVTGENEDEGVSRSAQMRSVLRMQCYVDSFSTDNQNNKIEQCIAANFTQDPQVTGLQIDAGDPPPKVGEFQCNASETPGSPEWEAIHYSHLPAGLIACPVVACEDACGFTNSSLTYYATTTPSPPPVDDASKVMCFRQLSTGSAAYWDFGSPQSAGTISANPSPGVYSISVYLTDHAPGVALNDDDLCGTIYESSRDVSCVSRANGRYLVLKATLQGTCVYGECVPAWCEMTLDGSSMTEDPQADTGSSFYGVVHDEDHESVFIPTTTTTQAISFTSTVELVGNYTADIMEQAGNASFLEECSKRLNPARCTEVGPLPTNIELIVGAVTQAELDDAMTIISTGHLALNGFGTFETA